MRTWRVQASNCKFGWFLAESLRSESAVDAPKLKGGFGAQERGDALLPGVPRKLKAPCSCFQGIVA